ncbi:hypothetical protein HY045_00515 [Candidatus Woesebacteria bacterium]|nr:hypothetical protein [Candidatus Woesebacteria bacterium]
MFKNVIAPIQAWLLSQDRCVGCGKDLSTGKTKKIDNWRERITCDKCGRVYIKDLKTNKVRRALLNEA